MTIRAVVRGIGHYLPERVVPNSEFEDTLDTSHEWIVSRSGIINVISQPKTKRHQIWPFTPPIAHCRGGHGGR